MENSDGICHLFPSCFLKCGTTKSIKLDTSTQKAGLPWWLSSEESASQPANTETRVGSLGQEDPLKKEMATHSSILAWENLWTEESGRL